MFIPEVGKYYANDYNDGIIMVTKVTPPPLGYRAPEDGFEGYDLHDGQMSETGFGWDETFSLKPATKEQIAAHRKAWSELTFKVRHYDKDERRCIYATKLVDGRKKVHCIFESRQKARNYIRNHAAVNGWQGAEVVWHYEKPNAQYRSRDEDFPNRARWDYEHEEATV